MHETFASTLATTRTRIAAVRLTKYARTSNPLDPAVSGYSRYITHGFVMRVGMLAVNEVLAG